MFSKTVCVRESAPQVTDIFSGRQLRQITKPRCLSPSGSRNLECMSPSDWRDIHRTTRPHLSSGQPACVAARHESNSVSSVPILPTLVGSAAGGRSEGCYETAGWFDLQLRSYNSAGLNPVVSALQSSKEAAFSSSAASPLTFFTVQFS